MIFHVGSTFLVPMLHFTLFLWIFDGMKKNVLIKCLVYLFGMFCFFVTPLQSKAQSDELKIEIDKIMLAKKSDYPAIYQKLEEMGTKDQTNWAPKYYAALARITQFYRIVIQNKKDPKINLELKENIEQVERLLQEASFIDNNQEVLILSAFSKIMKVKLDPDNGYQLYSNDIAHLLEQAKAKGSTENPRLLMVDAFFISVEPSSLFVVVNKDLAKENLKRALEIFKSGEPEKYKYMPTWGEVFAQDLYYSL